MSVGITWLARNLRRKEQLQVDVAAAIRIRGTKTNKAKGLLQKGRLLGGCSEDVESGALDKSPVLRSTQEEYPGPQGK